jgi:hypothetical protein
MDMPTDSPEAQEKCPACGEPNCLDHALRTAPPKAEAQPQGVPEKLFVQLTPMGGTISYVTDPRKDRDNRRPVYEYVRADLPRAAGETTVEAALAELREIFPRKKRVKVGASFSVINLISEVTCRVQVGNTLYMAATLADCMAQVRAAAQREGKVNDG